MKISLLHPTRSRPEKSIRAINSWIVNAGVGADLETIISCDDNDPYLPEYRKYYPEILVSNNRSAVDAVNRAAEACTGDIMIVVSDDSGCPKRWVRAILNLIKGKEDFVLKVGDGIQKWLITMPIIDRKYYNRFGYVYHPDYKHMFVDTHFTHVADCLGRVIWANHVIFKHNHYSVTKNRPDAINRRADATWNEGKRIYLQHVREKFGLNLDIWNIKGHQHIKWLKHHLR